MLFKIISFATIMFIIIGCPYIIVRAYSKYVLFDITDEKIIKSKKSHYRSILMIVNLSIIGFVFWSAKIAGHDKETFAYILLLAMLYLFIELILSGCLLLWEGISNIIYYARKESLKEISYDQSRRDFLANVFILPAISLSIGGLAMNERTKTIVNEYDISVKNIDVSKLPPAFNDLKIAQLSDIHMGLFYNLDNLKNLLDRTVETKAELLVFTGDIFDDIEINDEAIKVVDSYCNQFRYGIWFCYGNHEYYRNIKNIEEKLSHTNINVLRNSNQILMSGDIPVYMVGVDYPFNKETFLEDKKNMIESAFKNIPKESVKILLAHHPEFIDDGRENNILLTLTGHTHGCQFGLFGIPILPMFKYNRGLFHKGTSYGYVHSGNGSWFPFRFGCKPEIAIFNIRFSKN